MGLDFIQILYFLPGVVIGLTFHEFMHAFAAYKLGDPTPQLQNRLTLNPLKHIDPFGFIFILIAGFGWAKPVQFNRNNLRHPKRDEALIAVSGPLTNLSLALTLSLLFRLLILIFPWSPEPGPYTVILRLLCFIIFINYALFIFNMIPIPPLDGSHLVFPFLNIRPDIEAKIYRYGLLALFGILLLERATGLDILPIGKIVVWFMNGFFSLLGVGMEWVLLMQI